MDCSRCGAETERERKRTRNGTRWRVRCLGCGRKTRWHRPNGADLREWALLNG